MSQFRIPSTPSTQRGAVLFISLILLIVLSLLGIASMQVTTLQERMAGNYRTLNLAFQKAEGQARDREVLIQSVTGPNNYYVSNDDFCKNKYGIYNSADAWAQAQVNSSGPKVVTRRIDGCTAGRSSLKTGLKKNEDPNSMYEINSMDADMGTLDSSSIVIIETVFVP